VQVTVGGTTSTGDPYINFLVTGGGTWSIGPDNSVAGDPLVFANSAALGTTNAAILTSSLLALPATVECIVGLSAKFNADGHLISYYNNAAKWASGSAYIPHIQAFDEEQGKASATISMASRTDNGGMCRFAFIDVPNNADGDGTLHLANGPGAPTNALTSRLTISALGLLTLPGGLTVTGAVNFNTAANAINLGTDAAAKTITIGNATGATSVVINSGTVGVSVPNFLYVGGYSNYNESFGVSGAKTLTAQGALQGQVAINDSTAFAAGVGGGLNLVGNYHAGQYTVFASIQASKVNATDNDYGGDLLIATRANGGNLNTAIKVSSLGEVTMPLQPAFLATKTADQLNVTGNNEQVTITFTTEVFDQNADYDGTSTFTAPVTGRYRFTVRNFLGGLTAGMAQGRMHLITSNRNFNGCQFSYGAIMNNGGYATQELNVLTDMDAGDTALGQAAILLGATVVDFIGDAGYTNFSGHLVC
jgi:hypothetical protein